MYVGIIAAGGASSRTGLGAYTNKAALSLGGRTLLQHQLDFFARSGIERAFVIVRPEHVRLLSSRLSREEQRRVAFIVSDCASGWAGEVERAQRFVGDDDEVLLVSCDNLHAGKALRMHDVYWKTQAFFTFTSWNRRDASPTNGPVLGRLTQAVNWQECSGVGFVGDLFTGYIGVRGDVLFSALRAMAPSARGEKEITTLLRVLSTHSHFYAIGYPGTYDDVADLDALARYHARAKGSPNWNQKATLGAGVLLRGYGGVLLTEREDGRGWVPPGGVVDEGECFVETAIREVYEEIGLRVLESELRLLGVYPTMGKQGEPACSVLFHAQEPDGDLTRSDEVKSVRRVMSKEEAMALTIPFDMAPAIFDCLDGRELDVR